jgi:hypothetical protein
MIKTIMKKLLLFKKPESNLLFALAMTWIYVMIVFTFMLPFLSFSEIEYQDLMVSANYLALLSIGYIYFVVVLSMTFRQIKGLRTILYPLITFSIPVWTILFLFGISAVYLWLLIFVIPILFFGLPVALFTGLSLDSKKTKS